jgi:hypothetical protein
MPRNQDELWLKQDREDLLALLDIRFGNVPAEVVQAIERIDRTDTLQRLILVAANAASWSVFTEELAAGDDAFKLTGERFSPF